MSGLSPLTSLGLRLDRRDENVSDVLITLVEELGDLASSVLKTRELTNLLTGVEIAEIDSFDLRARFDLSDLSHLLFFLFGE